MRIPCHTFGRSPRTAAPRPTRRAVGQEVTLAEPFKPGHTTKIEIQVKLTGKLALPSTEKDKPGQLVTVAGTSKL